MSEGCGEVGKRERWGRMGDRGLNGGGLGKRKIVWRGNEDMVEEG